MIDYFLLHDLNRMVSCFGRDPLLVTSCLGIEQFRSWPGLEWTDLDYNFFFQKAAVF